MVDAMATQPDGSAERDAAALLIREQTQRRRGRRIIRADRCPEAQMPAPAPSRQANVDISLSEFDLAGGRLGRSGPCDRVRTHCRGGSKDRRHGFGYCRQGPDAGWIIVALKGAAS
jgi:hypothetical protein